MTMLGPVRPQPWTLTGRLATRVGWRGRLILQVEEVRTVERHRPGAGGTQIVAQSWVESRRRRANAPEAPR